MLELPYILVPWTYPLLQTQNFHLGGGIQLLKLSRFFDYSLILKAYSYYNVTKIERNISLFLKKNTLLYHIMIESQNKNMGPAINFQYALENFSAEILNNFTFMKSMLVGCLTWNFISKKFKELIAEKHREGLSCIKIN
jgi:hypothetical protein